MEEKKPEKKKKEAKVIPIKKEEQVVSAEVDTKIEVKTEDKPTQFHLPIDVIKGEKVEDGWVATMVDEDKTWSGEGDGPLSAVRVMLNKIEVHNIQNEKEKLKRFMILNFDSAKALCLQVIDLLGGASKDWFTVYQLKVKTGQPVEQLEARLRMLNQYGLVQFERPSGPGNRYRIVGTIELQKEILTRKLKAAKDEAEQLEFQLSNLLLNEPKPLIDQPHKE